MFVSPLVLTKKATTTTSSGVFFFPNTWFFFSSYGNTDMFTNIFLLIICKDFVWCENTLKSVHENIGHLCLRRCIALSQKIRVGDKGS